MNRKAQFFSIAGALLVLILVVVLGSQTAQIRADEELRVSRASAHVMDGFARNFASLDVPHTLRTASRMAIIRSSQVPSSIPLSNEQVVEVMKTGSLGSTFVFQELYGSDAHFVRVTRSLPFARQEDMVFEYSLLSVSQNTPDEIELVFNVSYSLSADNMQWREPGREYRVTIDTIGIRHPVHNQVIDETWVGDTGCLAGLLFSQASPCSGNLRPAEVIVT